MTVATRRQLCEWYGVTAQTISSWQRHGMAPEDYTLGNRRVWESEYVHDWLLQRAVRHLEGGVDELLNKEDEEARYKHHQANNEELKELKLRGELIPQAEVVHTLSSIIGAARSKALAIPSKVQGRFGDVSAEVVEEIKTLVNEMLTELSEQDIAPLANNPEDLAPTQRIDRTEVIGTDSAP